MAAKNRFEFLHPLYWPVWLGIGLLWLIIHLPSSLQIFFGKCFGKLLYCFPGKLKETTQINIKLCFPELSKKEQKKLIKKNYESLGLGLVEAAMAWWLPNDKLQNMFEVEGLEYVEAALAKGKGIILLAPHFICLEIIGRILGLNYTFAVIYRPHKKRLMAFIHERFRKKHYLEYIPRHRVRQIIRALNNNMPVWYAYDIDAGNNNGVFAPLFNIPASSMTSVSRLVRMTEAAVIPMSFYRSGPAFRYKVILYPPIQSFPSGDLTEDAVKLNAAIEKSIREKPEQYVWQYKRFKTRPEGEKRFY